MDMEIVSVLIQALIMKSKTPILKITPWFPNIVPVEL